MNTTTRVWAYRHSDSSGWHWAADRPSCGIENLDLHAAHEREPLTRFVVADTRPKNDPFSSPTTSSGKQT